MCIRILGGKGVLEALVQSGRRRILAFFLSASFGKQIADYTCAADVVYYGFDPHNPNARFSAPNKLYEALGSRPAADHRRLRRNRGVVRSVHVCGPEDLRHPSELVRHCHTLTVARLRPSLARLRAISTLFSRKPLTVPYFFSAELAAQIRDTLTRRSYDRIFVYCSAMAQYVEFVQGIPLLLDLVDVDSDKWRQYAGFARFPYSSIYRRECRCLREYERRACERASSVLVSTRREAQLVREISDVANIHVVPNGVDTEYFKPAADSPDPAEPAIIFTGDMSYFPNQEAVVYFARCVLPLVRQSVPEARFRIVGRNPTRKVQRLQQIRGVEVTGFVPDVRIYLTKSNLAVAPFAIAAGIQNKILEAMASGLPVVATSRAVQGLVKEVAGVVETADGAQELAARVVRLLRDPDFAHGVGMEGRQRVAAHYNWERTLNQLLQLLEFPAPAALNATAQ